MLMQEQGPVITGEGRRTQMFTIQTATSLTSKWATAERLHLYGVEEVDPH
jgi:hypothetical protein